MARDSTVDGQFPSEFGSSDGGGGDGGGGGGGKQVNKDVPVKLDGKVGRAVKDPSFGGYDSGSVMFDFRNYGGGLMRANMETATPVVDTSFFTSGTVGTGGSVPYTLMSHTLTGRVLARVNSASASFVSATQDTTINVKLTGFNMPQLGDLKTLTYSATGATTKTGTVSSIPTTISASVASGENLNVSFFNGYPKVYPGFSFYTPTSESLQTTAMYGAWYNRPFSFNMLATNGGSQISGGFNTVSRSAYVGLDKINAMTTYPIYST